MPKLSFYYFVALLCATSVYAQDRVCIYFSDLKSEGIEYSFSKNYERASFYIYDKGYETKKKRDSVKQLQVKKREENRRNLGYRIPPTGTVLYSSTPPERLESLKGIDLISPKEYREGKIKTTKFYIIVKCKEGGYLKWMANAWGDK